MKSISINMVRADLEDIPIYELPPGYSFRWHHPGDVEIWVAIHKSADLHNPVTPEVFDEQFGPDPQELPRRQCFLLDEDDNAIGTATAWFDNDYFSEKYGRLHWVAIVPEAQGRGLGKPLLSNVLTRMRDLGDDRAYLVTQPARIPAINLYRSFGFEPHIRDERDRAVWQSISRKLKHSLELS
jgi:GNAT superfamily N-acetyltransferase